MIQQNITIFLGVKTRLYYTWKPKDVKAETVTLFNYEIFQPTLHFLYLWRKLSFKVPMTRKFLLHNEKEYLKL